MPDINKEQCELPGEIMSSEKQRAYRYGCPVVLAILSALSGTAYAADTTDPGNAAVLQEVVVTATKRVTNEQTTPQSLTAFSATDLSAEHISSVADLAEFTPGLFVGSDNGFGTVTTAIRGFGPLNLSIGGAEAVGVYIDGVYQGTPYANQFTFIDVDQVEVLRGPQGTLYGQNATGGAIVLNTLTPGRDTIVRADIGVGELNSFQGRALVAGPLTDTLSGKIAIGRTTQDGWATNPILGEKLNGAQSLSTAAGLHWTPGGIWDFMLNAHYGTQDNTLAAKNAADGLPIDQIPAQFPNQGHREFSGLTLNTTATMPWATFTGVAGYTNANNHYLTSSANVGLTQFLELTKSSEFYEELRLASKDNGPISWMLGLTGMQQHASDVVDFYLTANLSPPDGLGIIFDNGLAETSYAGFAEVGWQMTPRIKLTVGDRYTRDKKDWSNCETFGQFSNLILGSYSPVTCNTPFNREARSWGVSTPKGIISVRFTDRLFGYASYNRGFRAGGWNLTSAVNPAAPYSTAFNPEYAKSYEVGLKSEIFDHRLRANVDAYLTDYTDLQVRTIDPVFHLFGVHNAGAARTKGVELQVLSKPVSALTVSANVAWERAIYTSFSYLSAGTPVNYAGNYLNDAPEWSGNIGVAYAMQWANHGTVTPRVDASYQSRVFYTEQNVAPYDGPGHEAINVHLRYDASSAPWGFDVYVNNATNNQWREYSYQGELTVVGANYALPRIVGIEFFWNE